MSVIHPGEEVLNRSSGRAAGRSATDDRRDSALFPAGAAGLYDRAARARRPQKTTSTALVAVPVAVLALGGALYVSTMMNRPGTAARAPIVAPASAPAATSTRTVAAEHPRAVNGPAQTVTQTTTRTTHAASTGAHPAPAVHRSSRRPVSAGEQAQSGGGDAAGSAASSSVPSVTPGATAATPNAAPSAPTPGTFRFTPPAGADGATASPTGPVSAAPQGVIDSAAPTAPPAAAQTSPQASTPQVATPPVATPQVATPQTASTPQGR